jgi:hypothetical protein
LRNGSFLAEKIDEEEEERCGRGEAEEVTRTESEPVEELLIQN